jgi:hypothetical protein
MNLLGFASLSKNVFLSQNRLEAVCKIFEAKKSIRLIR